jgi:hypothetical protein
MWGRQPIPLGDWQFSFTGKKNTQGKCSSQKSPYHPLTYSGGLLSSRADVPGLAIVLLSFFNLRIAVKRTGPFAISLTHPNFSFHL